MGRRVRRGRKDVVDYLLAHGAQHNIFSAVALGELTAIRELAAAAPGDVDRPMDRTNHRRRPLHLAVVSKRPESLAVLLELGADPEATDAAGLTPLDQAALANEPEMARMLIDAGALLKLPAAVALQQTADIERLMRDDPDCLKPGGRWSSLIVRASERAPGHVVEELIRLGASPNALDDESTAVDSAPRYTPLHAAAFNGNAEAVAVLLRHGADVNAREARYCATPAGWAGYAGHHAIRDRILDDDIDLFQAIDFDLAHRMPAIVRQSPWLLNKRFRAHLEREPQPGQWWPEPWQTPLARAVVQNKVAAVRVLLDLDAAVTGAPDGRSLEDIASGMGFDEVAQLLREHASADEQQPALVRRFIRNACPDHEIRGRAAHAMARNTAERLLKRFPELAQDSFYTRVVCGDLQAVERALDADADAARRKGGPNDWEPLLYLCFARLPFLPAASDHAVAMARRLLAAGADPNAYFMAGDSRYTALVGAIGEGEEDRPPHPQRDALVRLLLDYGAEPYDLQVVYNIHFHGDVLWFLKLMHEHASRRGRDADWQDPSWSMLDMGPYGSGARWHLDIARKCNDLALAEWALEHGASPNAPPATDPRCAQGSLYDEALRAGSPAMAELLLRHGAAAGTAGASAEDRFAAACHALDIRQARELAAQHPEFLRSTHLLFDSARRDRDDVVALLLDLGTSPDLQNEQGERALHITAYAGAVRVAQLLLERGAEVDPRDARWHATPLGYAVHGQVEPAIDVLGRCSRDIWNLVFTGNRARVRELLDEDPALARAVNEHGSTPLMWLPDDEELAVAMIRLLLEHGADAGARNDEGMTAADYARRRGLFDAAALLSRSV